MDTYFVCDFHLYKYTQKSFVFIFTYAAGIRKHTLCVIWLIQVYVGIHCFCIHLCRYTQANFGYDFHLHHKCTQAYFVCDFHLYKYIQESFVFVFIYAGIRKHTLGVTSTYTSIRKHVVDEISTYASSIRSVQGYGLHGHKPQYT